MSFTARKFQGAGIVSMRPYGTTQAMVDVGDVTAASIAQSPEKKSLPNLRGGGGNADSRTRVSERTLTLSFADWLAPRMALALKAGSTDVVGGTATDVSYTVKVGGVVRLAHIAPTSLVVKHSSGTPTFTLGSDYTLTHNGFEVPATGSTITDAATVLVSYAYSAHKVLEAFTAGDSEWEIHLDGLNDAKSGDKYAIDIWRWKPADLEEMDLLHSDDYGVLEVTGEMLADSTKGTSVSQFMRIKQAL